LVADEGAERFHRDVERGVEDPQRAGGDPQRRRVGHHEQRQRRQHRAREEVGTAPAQSGPGAIRQVADDGLNEQAGQRRRDPQPGHLVHLAPSVWKMRLTFAFCSANPNWMPRNPKHMFQICQNDRVGLDVIDPSRSDAVPAQDTSWTPCVPMHTYSVGSFSSY
jgi:hypothetical protein